MKVLAICGSLRQGSLNASLLRAALELAPERMRVETTSIRELPLYDEDLRKDGFPAPAQALIDRLAAADGLLLVTPEYNYSIPGGLKNAIDWFSRAPSQVFAGKAVALMSASPGALGGARAQYHLRQVCVFLDMHPLNKPEVMVKNAKDKFDTEGRLIDEETRGIVKKQLEAFAVWIEKLGVRA